MIERNDRNNEEVVEKITDKIKAIAGLNEKEYQAVAKNAKDVSKIALWENLISYYKKAYQIAIDKINERIDEIPVVEDDSGRLPRRKRQQMFRTGSA